MPVDLSRRRPPPELLTLTRVHTGGTALGPVAQVNTRRRRWVISDTDGRPLAELIDDRVSAHTMGEQTRAVS
jgi:hypothetical protein